MHSPETDLGFQLAREVKDFLFREKDNIEKNGKFPVLYNNAFQNHSTTYSKNNYYSESSQYKSSGKDKHRCRANTLENNKLNRE